ncbi:MAG: hypothetical protein GY805_31775 [Chloroflexi bacterium]|nr:hypothetical protein [Chloroflexota bacterium]
MRKLRASWLLLTFLLLLMVGTAVAQSDNELSLRLSKDFGADFGSNIQGTFSYRVSGPDNLASVTFYMDDQIIGEDDEEPFRLQFKTGDYALGVHTFSATGLTKDGQALTSNTLSRNFISDSDSTRSLLIIVVPILLLVFGGSLASWWISKWQRKTDGQTDLNVNGVWGGTICPKCSKPFAMHVWGLNIGLGKYDRCPHCGKWSVVRRAHPDVLNAAVEAIQQAEANNAPSSATNAAEDEASRRKRLDDSRFDG